MQIFKVKSADLKLLKLDDGPVTLAKGELLVVTHQEHKAVHNHALNLHKNAVLGNFGINSFELLMDVVKPQSITEFESAVDVARKKVFEFVDQLKKTEDIINEKLKLHPKG